VFELPQDFTIDDLNKAFQANQELLKTKLSQVEASIYKDALQKYYLQAKNHLRRKELLSVFNKISLFTNFSSSLNSFSIMEGFFFHLNMSKTKYIHLLHHIEKNFYQSNIKRIF
jgi:glucan-binding YG repeat protein